MSLLCSSTPSQCIITKTTSKSFKEWLSFITTNTIQFINNYLIKKIFKFILNIILYTIIIIKSVKIYLNEFKVRKKSLKDVINNFIDQIKCVPNHICFIINENINDNNLINLFIIMITTFSAYGVRFFTIYTREEIKIDVKKKFIKQIREEFLNDKKKIETNFEKDENTNNNGYNKDQIIKINLLTNINCGKKLFVNVVKNIAFDYLNNEIMSIDDINSNLVNNRIIDLSNINEPELVISIGMCDTLAGFSPWHVRLSEIMKIESYKLVNSDNLLKILKKYGNIEKRFGK